MTCFEHYCLGPIMIKPVFSKDLLKFDKASETKKICESIRSILSQRLKRRGLVVALSGGIDSSCCVALAVAAIGKDKVFSLLMPERHSSKDTLGLSTSVADAFGVAREHEDITEILNGLNFYQRYDAAVKKAIPEYGEGWKSKITISNTIEKKGFNIFYVVAQNPEGNTFRVRLPLPAYLEIVAATNFKQRTRKMLEYYHADRLNYAVTGTPNRLEYDQGFFVKLGDGAADIKPIAHLYKSQVYELAEYLGVPKDICQRKPTTDTYSLPQGQDEFYFSLPYDLMDLCLYGKNHHYLPEEVAPVIGLTVEQVQWVYDDIDAKRAATRYLHMPGQLVTNVTEITLE